MLSKNALARALDGLDHGPWVVAVVMTIGTMHRLQLCHGPNFPIHNSKAVILRNHQTVDADDTVELVQLNHSVTRTQVLSLSLTLDSPTAFRSLRYDLCVCDPAHRFILPMLS